jgi:hypothetical protein
MNKDQWRYTLGCIHGAALAALPQDADVIASMTPQQIADNIKHYMGHAPMATSAQLASHLRRAAMKSSINRAGGLAGLGDMGTMGSLFSKITHAVSNAVSTVAHDVKTTVSAVANDTVKVATAGVIPNVSTATQVAQIVVPKAVENISNTTLKVATAGQVDNRQVISAVKLASAPIFNATVKAVTAGTVTKSGVTDTGVKVANMVARQSSGGLLDSKGVSPVAGKTLQAEGLVLSQFPLTRPVGEVAVAAGTALANKQAAEVAAKKNSAGTVISSAQRIAPGGLVDYGAAIPTAAAPAAAAPVGIFAKVKAVAKQHPVISLGAAWGLLSLL